MCPEKKIHFRYYTHFWILSQLKNRTVVSNKKIMNGNLLIQDKKKEKKLTPRFVLPSSMKALVHRSYFVYLSLVRSRSFIKRIEMQFPLRPHHIFNQRELDEFLPPPLSLSPSPFSPSRSLRRKFKILRGRVLVESKRNRDRENKKMRGREREGEREREREREFFSTTRPSVEKEYDRRKPWNFKQALLSHWESTLYVISSESFYSQNFFSVLFHPQS